MSRDEEILQKRNLLLKQLDKLITSLSPEDCKHALTTLQICFKNIALHPHDDKYRQIKLNNKAFCNTEFLLHNYSMHLKRVSLFH